MLIYPPEGIMEQNTKENMKEVLKQLSKINSASERIVMSANREKMAYAKELEDKKKAYETSVDEEIEKELANLKLEIIASNQATIEKSRAEYEKRLSLLNESYEKNGKKWVDEIFDAITGETGWEI